MIFLHSEEWRMGAGFFSPLSLGIVFFLTCVLVFVSLYAGLCWRRLENKQSLIKPAPAFAITAGLFCGLFVFLLALTLNAAASRHDARNLLLLDEVNAIETAFLQADFLEPVDRDASRQLLRDYVQKRASVLMEAVSLYELNVQSLVIQRQLWSIVVTYPKGNVQATLVAAYASSLNSVFELHRYRLATGMGYHAHPVIWAALLLMASLSMIMIGFQCGQDRRQWLPPSFWLASTVSLALVFMLLLIADLDRPGEGLIVVDQTPMVALLRSLQPPMMFD
jgi:hypothetical protein